MYPVDATEKWLKVAHSNSFLFPVFRSSDKYSGCDYEIWASTLVIVWSADRPQEKGIHVHVNDGAKRIVDDTFSVVTLNGKTLKRKDVLQAMFERTIT